MAATKHSRAWTYDEGIDLQMGIKRSIARAEGIVRVLGHIGANRIHVAALHDSVNSQRSPVSLSLTKGERRDFTLCCIKSIERFVRFAVRDKGDDLQGLICIYRDVILASRR